MCETMNTVLLLVITICSCCCRRVDTEDCQPVDDGSHCHCRTESGYEIDLLPLAKTGEPA